MAQAKSGYQAKRSRLFSLLTHDPPPACDVRPRRLHWVGPQMAFNIHSLVWSSDHVERAWRFSMKQDVRACGVLQIAIAHATNMA
jgi:hypothetical protein